MGFPAGRETSRPPALGRGRLGRRPLPAPGCGPRTRASARRSAARLHAGRSPRRGPRPAPHSQPSPHILLLTSSRRGGFDGAAPVEDWAAHRQLGGVGQVLGLDQRVAAHQILFGVRAVGDALLFPQTTAPPGSSGWPGSLTNPLPARSLSQVVQRCMTACISAGDAVVQDPSGTRCVHHRDTKIRTGSWHLSLVVIAAVCRPSPPRRASMAPPDIFVLRPAQSSGVRWGGQGRAPAQPPGGRASVPGRLA